MADCCDHDHKGPKTGSQSLPVGIKPQGASVSYRIIGMDCADEVAVLKRELAQIVGGVGNLSTRPSLTSRTRALKMARIYKAK